GACLSYRKRATVDRAIDLDGTCCSTRAAHSGGSTRPQLRILCLEGLLGVEDACPAGGRRGGGPRAAEGGGAAPEGASGDRADAGVDGDVLEGARVGAPAEDEPLGDAPCGAGPRVGEEEAAEARLGGDGEDGAGDGAPRGGGGDASPVPALEATLGGVLARGFEASAEE